jgi:cardiolipin synthase
MSWWDRLDVYEEVIAGAGAILGPVLSVATIVWILVTKKNPTSAAAWCLLVFFLPLVGPLLFLLFGYQHVNRPLSRKRRHRRLFRGALESRGAEELVAGTFRLPLAGPGTQSVPATTVGLEDSAHPTPLSLSDSALAGLAQRFGAFPITTGNELAFYHEGRPAFDAMLEAIRSARHHVHLETFIFQPDTTGQTVLDALSERARQGVEVRLLYDAMGTHRLSKRLLQSLRNAGGKYSLFLPINPLRRRIQINMRNHRKLLIVDGRVAFTGGLNVGDEYLCRSQRFGFWRDTHLRLQGPAVAGLQRIFAEDWDFAAGETLQDPAYFPRPRADGSFAVQIIESGPDREQKTIREVYFAAILRARRRVWIASPYFVPDPGLLDAISLAGYLGLDVRLLCQYHPDKWIPYFAARYYFNEVLGAGVKVYQYTKGMMHAKVLLVDDDWASVGSANLDNRSMYLNFEVNCLLYSPAAVAELERAFRHDLTTAIRLDPVVFQNRPFTGRLLDNACRLLSPIL